MEDGALVAPVSLLWMAQMGTPGLGMLGQVIVALTGVNWLRCCPTANCKDSSPVFLVKVEQQTVLWPLGVCNAIAYLPESAASYLELQVSQNIISSLLTKQSTRLSLIHI